MLVQQSSSNDGLHVKFPRRGGTIGACNLPPKPLHASAIPALLELGVTEQVVARQTLFSLARRMITWPILAGTLLHPLRVQGHWIDPAPVLT